MMQLQNRQAVSKASAVSAQPVQTAQVKEAAPEKPAISQGIDDAELPDAKSKSGSTDQQYCSEKRYPDSGFLKKQIGLLNCFAVK